MSAAMKALIILKAVAKFQSQLVACAGLSETERGKPLNLNLARKREHSDRPNEAARGTGEFAHRCGTRTMPPVLRRLLPWQ